MENEKNKDGNFLLGFFLGGLLSTALIFLFGTEEGKKTAKKFSKILGTLEDELKEKGGEILEETDKVKKTILKETNKGKKNLSKVVSAKMDNALTTLEHVQKKGIKLTRDAHGRFFSKNGKKLVK